MKVALLFVGRILTWEHCYDRFKKYILDVLEGCEIDGYLCHHSDNSLTIRCTPHCNYCCKKDAETSSSIDDFKAKYHIKHFINVSHDITQYYTIFDKNHCPPIRMHYCWLKGFELIKSSGIDYDLVIYLRADEYFCSNLIIPTIPLTDKTLYIPTGNDHQAFGMPGLNDQFAMGNMKAMEHYTSFFTKMMETYETTKIPFNSEVYLKIHNSDMDIIRFPLHSQLHRGRNNK